jgi:hypothetical protein
VPAREEAAKRRQHNICQNNVLINKLLITIPSPYYQSDYAINNV